MNWMAMDWLLILEATFDTLLMTGVSLLFAVLIGLPVGVALFMTGPGQFRGYPAVYQTLSLIVNVLRSVPFLILLIVMIPLTRVLAGTSLGVAGSIPPLVASAAPFFARLVETSLKELNPGVSEACRAMGATPVQTVWLALLPEARTGILAGVVVTAIMLVGYSAMSGVIGGGGLGDLAVRFGYQRYQTDVMVVTVLILVVMVQLMQLIGDRLVDMLNRRIS
ncbi:methionine ABC transporter permease [Orrella sp. 11846]|uniref:methionine ABC transporter permease n=1 Tax=Orrella sp. 11846 TaxID=3409913 RepID=UPI003B5AB071